MLQSVKSYKIWNLIELQRRLSFPSQSPTKTPKMKPQPSKEFIDVVNKSSKLDSMAMSNGDLPGTTTKRDNRNKPLLEMYALRSETGHRKQVMHILDNPQRSKALVSMIIRNKQDIEYTELMAEFDRFW